MFRWFIEEQDEILGGQPWIYGLGEPNRKHVETIVQYSFEQGLIGRKITMEERSIDTVAARL